MHRFLFVASLSGVFACGCSRPSAQVTAPATPPELKSIAGNLYRDYVVGGPVSHRNLTIFPISSKTLKDDDRFLTLDEGLAAGTVKIIETGASDAGHQSVAQNADPLDMFGTEPQPSADSAAPEAEDTLFGPASQLSTEQGASAPTLSAVEDNPFGEVTQQSAEHEGSEALEHVGEVSDTPFADGDDLFGSGDVDGDVNELMVLNTSGKPLYLMPGEIISGGKQDRTIGEELVIASSDTPVPIDVFCVEHGRWAGRSVADTTSQLAAADFEPNLALIVSQTQSVEEIAQEAQRGQFVASVGQLSKDARLAVQDDAAQAKVWDEVAKTNSKVGNDSESGNFAASYYSGEVVEDLAPFMNELKSIAETKQIVGVAVAVDGKMLSIDIFESTPLFKKFWPKLLKSYALDAVAAEGDSEEEKNTKAITVDDCIAFLKDVESSNAETKHLADGQWTDRRESELGISFSYHDAATAAHAPAEEASMGFGGGGGGFGGGVHTSVLAK